MDVPDSFPLFAGGVIPAEISVLSILTVSCESCDCSASEASGRHVAVAGIRHSAMSCSKRSSLLCGTSWVSNEALFLEAFSVPLLEVAIMVIGREELTECGYIIMATRP